MKKLAVSVCLLLFMSVLFVSGCQEKNGDDGSENQYSRMFIGEWLNTESSSYNERWTFYNNGTLKIIVAWEVEEEPTVSTFWFNYEATADNLCLSSIDELPDSPSYYLECHGFTFSDDLNHLTLTVNGMDVIEFEKIAL